jgi:hypothetical protein
MAATNVNEWVPVEYGGKLFQQIAKQSALLTVTSGAGGRRETMTSRTKVIPKATEVDVQFTAKGAAYGLDTTPVETFEIEARKMTAAVQLDEEDIQDTKGFVNTVEAKRIAAFNGFTTLLDNAAFAASGDKTDEPTMTRPYTSLYNAMSALGTFADQRFTFSRSADDAADFRAAILGAVDWAESSDWNDGSLAWIIAFGGNTYLRNNPVDGSNGQPIWTPAENSIAQYPIAARSKGLRLSVNATQRPTGNPLMFVGPLSTIVAGIRQQLQWRVTDPHTGIGALSETSYFTAEQRIAAGVGAPEGWAVVELTP